MSQHANARKRICFLLTANVRKYLIVTLLQFSSVSKLVLFMLFPIRFRPNAHPRSLFGPGRWRNDQRSCFGHGIRCFLRRCCSCLPRASGECSSLSPGITRLEEYSFFTLQILILRLFLPSPVPDLLRGFQGSQLGSLLWKGHQLLKSQCFRIIH